MKLTVVFIGCGQCGIDEYANYYMTRVIKLTDEQKKLLTPPENMSIKEVIFEGSEVLKEKEDA
jgi:hypothetical protein